MSDIGDIVWDYLVPEDLEYCKAIGARRNALRVAAGNRNRVKDLQRAVFFNQIGVKGEFAFASRTGLRPPTAGAFDDRVDFTLGRFRIDVKTNATLRHKHLLVRDDGRSPPDPSRTDILVLAGTKDLDDPWVCLVGWISVDSWYKQRKAVRWGKDKSPTFIITQDRLYPMTTLPSWPIEGPPKPDINPPDFEQNRLL